MRICLISDVHSNYPALLSVRRYLENADFVIGLGDYVGYYCFVNETLNFLKSLPGIFVLGNHDRFLLDNYPSNANESVRFGIDFAKKEITEENKAWLASLPLVWGGFISRKSFLLFHGSPWNPLGDYLYDNNEKIQFLEHFSFDIIAYGQTHRAQQIRFGERLAINPGSIGQSRSDPSVAEMVFVDTDTEELNVVRQKYDWEKTLAHTILNGAGDRVKKHFPL